MLAGVAPVIGASIVRNSLPTSEMAPLLGDIAALEARVGRAVFIEIPGTGMRRARPLEQTVGYRVAPRASRSGDLAPEAVSMRIVPILKKASSPVVTVGRAPSNDIMIDDVTLSKLNSFLRESPSGFTIEDAGSTNGTFVDDVPVAVRGSAPAVPLPRQCVVRFGSIALVFLRTNALAAFLAAPMW